MAEQDALNLLNYGEVKYKGPSSTYRDISEIEDWYNNPQTLEDVADISSINHEILSEPRKEVKGEIRHYAREKNLELGAVLEGLEKKLGRGKKYSVTVGWFAGAHSYPESNEDVADVAAFQEYGGSTIAPNFSNRKRPAEDNKAIVVPPRPFMRPTVRKNANDYLKMAAMGVIGELLKDNGNPDAAMRQVGERVKVDLQEAIHDVHFPRLSRPAVRRREYLWTHKDSGGAEHGTQVEKPLIDTGLMINSIDIKVS